MSSFKNAAKSHRKKHRERSQLSGREHLGLLEKKKDYKLRATDYQRKQKTIKALRQKALDKNPDEFYFKMIRSRMEDGVHHNEDKAPTYTEDQLKLMSSQDIKYVNYKRSCELKKIERLKSSLHMLDDEGQPKNKHTFFVDSKKEAKSFDPAKQLNTHPALLCRSYNRPTMDMLKAGQVVADLDEDTFMELSQERKKQYKELGKRIDREKELSIIAQKMEVKTHLMDKKARKKKVCDETRETAAVYKWTPQRKK